MKFDPDLKCRLEAFYRLHGISGPAHRTVLEYLLLEPPRPAMEAASRCPWLGREFGYGVLPKAEYQVAIHDMIQRDLVWEIDKTKQELIGDYLRASPALGPTDGIPDLGTLQISIRMANLLDEFWAGIDYERPQVLWSRYQQSEKVQLVYSRTLRDAFDFLRNALVEDENGDVNIEHLSGPNPCGPWRCYWWRRCESGFVLEVRYV